MKNLSARAAARWQSRHAEDPEAGVMASEYAMATACGGAVLSVFWMFLKSTSFQHLLEGLVKHFLHW